MRLFVVLLAALAVAAAPADAAQKAPTAKKAAAKKKEKPGPPGPFDGLYRGLLTPAPALSKQPCNTVPVQDFEIDRSKIVTLPGILSFEGTVTGAGFVSGTVHYFGDNKAPVQGRITSDLDGTHLRAGVIDDEGGCAWTMDLKKQ
jgi:hypothetical protein